MSHLLSAISKTIRISLLISLSMGILGSLLLPVTTYAEDSGISAFNVLPFECLFGCDDASTPENEELLGAVQEFLVDLAPVLAALVIAYGGYRYFFGGIDGKSDGRQTILAGVIGLSVVLLSNFAVGLLNGGGDPSQALINDSGFNTAGLQTFLDNLANLLINLAGAVAVVVIIVGGYKYLFSSIPGGKEDGQRTILNGTIGLIVVILAREIKDITISVAETIEAGASGNILGSELVTFIVNLTNYILIPLSAAVTVFFLVLGGYQYIVAREQYQVGNARKNLLNALIGFIVVILSVTVVQLIYYIAGTL